ncbi:hypothetical protein GN244_ATG01575 [Phytophthora infestans]|uniref:Uncharacterized protein n=1 Tax=Phytophthora infestans TaxID=4787 RepID=A0A833TSQ0_PHYIN|nr:hypothetical protein GN244_ATG01575 [Phytophthora infestans]
MLQELHEPVYAFDLWGDLVSSLKQILKKCPGKYHSFEKMVDGYESHVLRLPAQLDNDYNDSREGLLVGGLSSYGQTTVYHS